MRPSYFVFVSLTTPTLALPAPGPIRTPGCPLSSERGGYSRVVARIWSDSTSAEIQDLPSFIDDFLVPEFVGADDTSNYPGPDEGTSLPVIGILGTSKQQFTDAIMEYRTKLFAVTGPIERTTINYGQGPSGICTEVQSLFNMTATLQVDYGGKAQGTTIWWLHTEVFNLIDEDPDADIYSWMIKNVTVTLDWSSFYL